MLLAAVSGGTTRAVQTKIQEAREGWARIQKPRLDSLPGGDHLLQGLREELLVLHGEVRVDRPRTVLSLGSGPARNPRGPLPDRRHRAGDGPGRESNQEGKMLSPDEIAEAYWFVHN